MASSLCGGCNQTILDRYVFHVLDKAWHGACLRCADCSEPMTESCFSRDGLLLCKEDFSRRFGARCAGCDGPLDKEDMVRRARDKVFHVQCFICSICQRRLDTGEQLYILGGNRFVCERDYSSAPSCPAGSSECGSDVEDDVGAEHSDDVVGEAETETTADKTEDPAAAAKRRGPRTTIKAKQLETLKNAFATTPKPTRHIREQLAQETGLNMRVIQVWFQNRRSKERRMKQLRYGGYRPTRRSRGGARDELCTDMYQSAHDPSTAGFFPPPPMAFYCDVYAGDRSGATLPPPSFALPPPTEQSLPTPTIPERFDVPHTSPLELQAAAAVVAAAAAPGDFEEESFRSLHGIYPPELKTAMNVSW